MLDSDVDSISSAEDLSLQEQPSAGSLTSQLRWLHLLFVYKIYITSLLLVIGVSVQWFLITKIKLMQHFVIFYNYFLLIAIFIHFLMLNFIHYVLRDKNPKFKAAAVIYIFMLVEFGSVIISRPIVESNEWSVIYATILTLLIYSISVALASKSHMRKERLSENLSFWSLRCFLATAICLIIATEISLAILQVSLVIIIMFFQTIFFIMWGLSLGSVKFYQAEYSYPCYYIMLHYFNILSLFANVLVFFQKIKGVM